MKKFLLLWGLLVTCFISGSLLFTCCTLESNNHVVQYYGKVVHKGSVKPFPDLEVKITNGSKINCVGYTDDTGIFALNVKVAEIDATYYLLVGDATCVPKQIPLSGFAQNEVDLGTIEIEGPSMPTVTTDPINNITAESATSGGNVTNDGRQSVTARGVCWSKSESPTIDDDHTTNGEGLGLFQSKLTNLERGMTYYVRAYATNAVGTAYGEQQSFSTTTGLPVVTTDTVTNVSATNATCGGDVAANSGYLITARGLCWSALTATPSISDNHTSEVANTGHFTSMMIGLERNTTYYVRAYASNEVGTGYGETRIFTTTDGKPQVITGEVSNITSTSATVSVNVLSAGEFPITACGVCWSNATSTPSLTDNHTSEVARTGEFTSKMINLTGMLTYYVRAYATNSNGTVYGNTVSFFTSSTADGLPIVETLDPGENITTTSITSGGNVTNDGGFTVTECGVVYSTLPYPTLSNASKVIGGSGKGYYSATITNISPSSNTYYIRAYATNQNGTAYGNQITITPERSEYLSLKTMSSGGYTYRIKFIGELSWYDGSTACQNMILGGFSDWFMPNNAEVQEIISVYGLWNKYATTSNNSSLRMDGCSSIWTSQESGSYAEYYYLKDIGSSSTYKWTWTQSTSSTYKSNLKGVYAVRKYTISNTQ